MSRRNAKKRTQLARTGRRPEVAKAATLAAAATIATAAAAQPVPADFARRGALNALDKVPLAETSPSLALARRFEVDPSNYTARERRAATYALDFNGASMDALSFVSSTGFPGFPTLVLLAQLPEYRAMHEVLADECIRTWGEAIGGTKEKTDTSMLGVSGNAASTSDGDQLKQINDEIERLRVRDAVRTTVIHDQAFGRAHPYFKIKGDDRIMDTPLVPRPYTVPKGSFQGLRVVEPYWVTPNNYNSINPVADDFYKPSTWWMIGSEVHATRLHTIVSRPVGDMLKPTYSFAGISMTQLAMPYIDNWLRTRQSVSDIVKQFSVSGILMDLAQALTPGANVDLSMRAELINRYRDNRNILFLDKATEEFFQFNTPLSGLDALQAQAQEQMSAVSHIPLIKLLGITPTGLNASSEGEIRVWYDYVRAYQRNALQQLMNDVIVMIQLSLFGAVDPSIKWQWNSLREMDDVEVADARYKEAQTDALYIQEQVIRPDQVAARLNTEPDGPYAGKLDANDQPGEPADDDIDGILTHIQRTAEGADTGAPAVAAPTASVIAPTSAMDSEWEESAHPRADNGQFGSGSGAGASKPKLSAAEKSAVSSYSGDNFLRINTALRQGDTSDPDIGRLDSAIGKQMLGAGRTLYRGMTMEAAKQLFAGGQIDKGATISDKAFASTSTDAGEARARGFGGVVLKIETGDNAKGLDMSAVSRNANEREVLLPRDAKMTIQGVIPPKRLGDPVVVRVTYGDA